MAEAAGMGVDRNGLEILERPECLALLESGAVARVAVTADALPAILPVNYRMVGEDVVFASPVGSKFLAMMQGQVVAFEIDEVDPATRSGWSVLVVGVAEELSPWHPYWERLGRVDTGSWMGRHASHLMTLSTDRVSGRRLHPAGRDVPAEVTSTA